MSKQYSGFVMNSVLQRCSKRFFLRKDEWSDSDVWAKMLQKMIEYLQRPCSNESSDRSKYAAKSFKCLGSEMFANVVIQKFRED